MFQPGELPAEHFQLPMHFELAATFLLAVTGALAAIEKRYDFVGVFVLALIAATGGALLRDGLFLQRGAPVVLQDERYLYAVAAATLVCLVFGGHLNRFRYVFLVADALGLGIYGVVGTERALDIGLHVVPAVSVGVVNAIGGGALRDILTGHEVLVFRPGEFYALAALIGTAVFGALDLLTGLPTSEAAWYSIAATLLIRMASIRFNWRTRAAQPLLEPKAPS